MGKRARRRLPPRPVLDDGVPLTGADRFRPSQAYLQSQPPPVDPPSEPDPPQNQPVTSVDEAAVGQVDPSEQHEIELVEELEEEEEQEPGHDRSFGAFSSPPPELGDSPDHSVLVQQVFDLEGPSFPLLATASEDEESSSSRPPTKRIRRAASRPDSTPEEIGDAFDGELPDDEGVDGEEQDLDIDLGDEEEEADLERSKGLGDFSRVFSFISAEKSRLLGTTSSSPASPSAITSSSSRLARSLQPKTSTPARAAATSPDHRTVLSPALLFPPDRPASMFPAPIPIPSYSRSDLDFSADASPVRNTLLDCEIRQPPRTRRAHPLQSPTDAMELDPSSADRTEAMDTSGDALKDAPSTSTPSTLTTVVVKAAYVRPEGGVTRMPGKAIYERPLVVVAPPVAVVKGAAFPLSLLDKSRSLPLKLEMAFPDDTTIASVSSSRLYSPSITRIVTDRKVAGPIEGVLYGFWPAPPPLHTGKGLYPAPLVLPESLPPPVDERPRVEVFVDNSNIMYSFLNWLRARPEAQYQSFGERATKTVVVGGKKAQLDYTTLFAILERGRKVERRVLIGSSPLWQGLDTAVEWGYEVSVLQRVPRSIAPPPRPIARRVAAPISLGSDYPLASDAVMSNTDTETDGGVNPKKGRGKKGTPSSPPALRSGGAMLSRMQYKEQAVDELLHMKIFESLLDYDPVPNAPRPLIVLATGDANSSEYNPTGFLGCARRALQRGWDVEIIAFPSGISSSWWSEEKQAEELAREMGEGTGQRGRLRVVNLEDFAEELVK